MATKWKNKLAPIVWLLLFTFGLSGITLGLSHSHEYMKKDYFHIPQFQEQFNQFINSLSVLELNYVTQEEAKKAITVTADDINEHRYRYGDLPQQITNIKGQYEGRIQDALVNNNKKIADIFIAERDKKIEDITNNFESDEYVRVKVIKEKEEKINNYYRNLKSLQPDLEKNKSVFKYYLKETTTGAVYTNLNMAQGIDPEKGFNGKELLFTQRYQSEGDYLSIQGRNSFLGMGEFRGLIPDTARVFEGYIAIPKSAPVTSEVIVNYRDFQQKKSFFFVYSISGLIALLFSVYLYRITAVKQTLAIERWQQYYNHIPVDVRIILFLISGYYANRFLNLINNNVLYFNINPYNLYDFIIDLSVTTLFTVLFVALTLIQGKYLLAVIKDWPNLKTEWPKTLLYRALEALQEAFLIRSIGTQIFILLAMVFSMGAGMTVVFMYPQLIVLYAPFTMAMGIPIIVIILKRTGYFNRILTNVSKLAQGNFEEDLPVVGKTVLAKLAENINILKHGVKSSQKEQAKSERLKTELITNVSHDLRTPLTSIITYTELLKTPDLAAEDREAYIHIIDRKSKRLKVLIDDLFEASKMASGNIELAKEKVDLVQLLQQALGEHNETIEVSTLQFRVTKPDTAVYAYVDGQKLWRVFDNLISNILKYSLENTRVYITVQAVRGSAVITFKNVTKYELGQDSEELFERFKRGDKSRHAEGTGLGLAIAKSIVDLHGGSLDIELDGDLFKITITLKNLIN
ncbi:MAG: HAMP domain-containing sensor histidine kinase [Clostridia bacterium]|nr:HAMP domain-containing sensor histidine kinase [Clostridia bacterium]